MTPPLEADESLAPPAGQPSPWLQVYTSHNFQWNRYELPIANLNPALEGFRILHLTDVHLRPTWRKVYDELFARIDRDPPDIILFSGDVIEHQFDHRPALATTGRFLRALRSRLGTWVTIGNHDGDLLGPHIERFGANLINAKFVRFEDVARSNATIELIGVPSVARDDASDGLLNRIPPRDLTRDSTRDRSREPGALRIALNHFPDIFPELMTPQITPDLILAGHTHGGQICLPGRIPIIKHTSMPRRYVTGVHRFGDTWLVIGRGFGFATWQIRMFCPAEVIELRLTRRAQNEARPRGPGF